MRFLMTGEVRRLQTAPRVAPDPDDSSRILVVDDQTGLDELLARATR